MDELTPQKHPRLCPSCGSDRIHRSMRKGFKDWFQNYFFAERPYRCNACDERFYAVRQGHRDKEELKHHPV
jgi:hypothetical protein